MASAVASRGSHRLEPLAPLGMAADSDATQQLSFDAAQIRRPGYLCIIHP